mmetsp:Transcript_19799/g.30493  ORF Transcript_19799/g.30493 Transcript_19799/m.30493 type:complete len:231 (-) Transcript_19799:1315-2007(-)
MPPPAPSSPASMSPPPPSSWPPPRRFPPSIPRRRCSAAPTPQFATTASEITAPPPLRAPAPSPRRPPPGASAARGRTLPSPRRGIGGPQPGRCTATRTEPPRTTPGAPQRQARRERAPALRGRRCGGRGRRPRRCFRQGSRQGGRACPTAAPGTSLPRIRTDSTPPWWCPSPSPAPPRHGHCMAPSFRPPLLRPPIRSTPPLRPSSACVLDSVGWRTTATSPPRSVSSGT